MFVRRDASLSSRKTKTMSSACVKPFMTVTLKKLMDVDIDRSGDPVEIKTHFWFCESHSNMSELDRQRLPLKEPVQFQGLMPALCSH